MNNKIKILVVIVLLGGAAYFGWANLGGPTQTDAVFDRTVYILCKNKACSNELEMTQRQVNEMTKTGEEMPCPKCGKKELDYAVKCSLCQKLALPGAHGAPPKSCPNCKKPWPLPKSRK